MGLEGTYAGTNMICEKVKVGNNFCCTTIMIWISLLYQDIKIITKISLFDTYSTIFANWFQVQLYITG